MKIKIGTNHFAEVFALDMKPTAVKVYLAVLAKARAEAVDGVVYIAENDIALAAGLSLNTVLACLSEIKAHDYIAGLRRSRVEEKAGTFNKVTFHARK